MLNKKPFPGIIAFLIVLFAMPLGHAAMIIIEKGINQKYIYWAAIIIGIIGLITLIIGILASKELTATLSGLIAGLFIWTGWIEFAYVYFANRFNVEPLIQNNTIITKPEYLIMPSSIGFWATFMLYYFFGTKTGCKFFSWFQKKLNIQKKIQLKPAKNKNTALTTFIEIILILWTFYLILLFAYDNNFAGDKHFITYFIAFASLFWSIILLYKLLKINKLPYAIRYAIPTVIIFWNFIEILGRWNFFTEIWIQPSKYQTEMIGILTTFTILISITLFKKKSLKNKKQNISTSKKN